MSYFFVDGLHAGQPTLPLYIKADTPEAALERAAKFGVQGVRVRAAKDAHDDPDWGFDSKRMFILSISIPVIYVLIVALVERNSEIAALDPAFGFMLLAFVLMFRMVQRSDSSRSQLASEVSKLREFVEHLQGRSLSPSSLDESTTNQAA